MQFKCRRKLSIAAGTRLECSRDVPSCSCVIDDVANFLTVLRKRSQSALVDITACRQGRRDIQSPPLAEVLQPKKLLKSQLVLLKMPLHFQSRKLKPRATPCFQDGHNDIRT